MATKEAAYKSPNRFQMLFALYYIIRQYVVTIVLKNVKLLTWNTSLLFDIIVYALSFKLSEEINLGFNKLVMAKYQLKIPNKQQKKTIIYLQQEIRYRYAILL